MEVDYATLSADIDSGALRIRLEEELTRGFRAIREGGDRLPPPSHYAARIAEIIGREAPEPLGSDDAFRLFQEILAACEHAHATVLGENPAIS